MLYICDNAKYCEASDCNHIEPHENVCLDCKTLTHECGCKTEVMHCTNKGLCIKYDIRVQCIPLDMTDDFISKEEILL